MMPTQIAYLKNTFTNGLLVMLIPTILSISLGYWWIISIETVAKNIKSKTTRIIGERQDFTGENEFESINQNFNDLHDELQNKMNQLNEVSKKLIDSNLKLKKLATTDGLTTLYNRRYFDSRLVEETSRSDRYKQELSLIMIDLDDFKKHNDTHGHQTGDKILLKMADLIRKSTRKSDMVFRYGGDEFAVLVPGCDLKKAEHLAKELSKKVAHYQFDTFDGQPLDSITISTGVACYSGNIETFVTEADKHLLAAKSTGKRPAFFQA
jgi:diguanylate cyclase (GGDEF)-like protein